MARSYGFGSAQKKKALESAFSLYSILSVKNLLGKLYGLNDAIALVDSHVARCDLVDKNYLALGGVAELELDVPKVKTDGLEVVCNDLGDCKGLSLHAFEHFGAHNTESCKTFAGNERIA